MMSSTFADPRLATLDGFRVVATLLRCRFSRD